MKKGLNILKPLLLLCSAIATTAAFGQTTYTWTNNAAVADLGTAANWNPNGVPFIGSATVTGDTMQFDGQTTGPVQGTSNGGAQTGSSVGNALAGIWVHLTSNQTQPVTFLTTVANSASSGIRFNSINIDSGAGAFTLGVGSTTNCLDTLWGTSNPSGQGLTNNSANPARILPDVRWRLGAGGAHTFSFAGTGDWYVTNDIANVNGAASLVDKEGTGSMYWTAGHNSYWGTISVIASPITIGQGRLVLCSGGLFPANTTINNSGTLVLDAPAGSQAGGAQTVSNPINGVGDIEVKTGTLTLSGANAYTGNTFLSGGTLVLSRAESIGINGPLGVGGPISFNGGTMVFSSVNAYDYSPRFTNSDNQVFRFDTAGQNVTFTNALVSNGGTLTKLGSGTLTLTGANTYTGAKVVAAGKLVIEGTSGTGAIIVSNSAALGVKASGTSVSPTALTLGTTSGATLEFNNVNSTSTPLIAAGSISPGGTITVNVLGGTFAMSTSYPLFSWSSGVAPAVTLGSLVGAVGNLSTNGSTIQLNVTGLSYVWRGTADANWDTATLNWLQSGSSAAFANGSAALFDDTVTTANTNIILNAAVSPASTTVNSAVVPYTITSAGANLIGGTGSLTKNGNSTLVLAGGVNTYTGPTVINGGILSVSTLDSGNAPSDIGQSSSAAASLVLNGGTLFYTGGGATLNRLFTLGTAGGTINDDSGGGLNLNNAGSIAMSGTGARTLTLAGNGSDELDAALSDNGGATALTKSGPGMWVVTANHNISGNVTINGGTLQVGNGGANGSVGSGNVSIDTGAMLYYYNTRTVTNGIVSGSGALSVDGGAKVVLPGNNSYSGGTTIAYASTLQVGVGGATGQLSANANVSVDGTLIFDTTGTFAYGGTGIAGGGNLIVRGGGKIISLGANSYGGWTEIGAGSTFQPCQGNQGALASSVVTNNGTLLLIRQDNGQFIYAGPVTGSGRVFIDANNFNSGDATLTGNCDYTGGTFIGDNGLIVGDGATSGSIIGNVTFVNSTQVPNDNTRVLAFNRSDDITFSGNIVTNFASTQSNQGIVQQIGTGTLTLTGNNTYGSGTVVSNGAVNVGNGGTVGTIGTGPITSWSLLSFKHSDDVAFAGGINGTGVVAQAGSGKLTLSGNLQMSTTIIVTNEDLSMTTNVYSGTLASSNGTLVVTSGSLNGSLVVAGGTFAPASLSAGGSLTVSSNATIAGGTLFVPLNKSLLPQTNITVNGALTRTGGTLVVTNVGPALVAGDKFYIFSKPVSGLTVTGAGATWQNDLSSDGSITAITVPLNPNPPVVQYSVSGNTLSLSWPTNLGWILQSNSVSVAASNQWYTIAGSSAVTSTNITINPAIPNVFFRMVHP